MKGAWAIDPFELYGLSLCSKAQFKCVSVNTSSKWENMFPDPKIRDMVQRLNRTDGELKYRHWIVVPRDLKDVTYQSLSPLPQHIASQGKRLIFINLKKSAFGAYDESGNLVYWGPATGGRDKCENSDLPCTTQEGTFEIFRKKGPECVSSEFPNQENNGGAAMPYCMFFYRGFAIHASPLYGFMDLSHGCVRVLAPDAKWLNQNFAVIGTRVVVIR